MIDVHSHILPNVDDGARSMEETYNLIEEAKKAGFTDIIVTSHYIEGYYEKDVETRQNMINEISNNVKDINIHIGNEVYISENITQLLQDKKIVTMNNTKYLLFEMPMNIKPMNLYEVVYEIMQEKMIPVLAHPERYSFVVKEPKLIYELIQMGVLMQSNYGSIIGQYGKSAEILAKKFLKNDMVHFLGTDVHRENTIYTKIPEIKERLEKIIGEDRFKELSEINPRKMLNNEEINIKEPKEIKYTLKEKIMQF